MEASYTYAGTHLSTIYIYTILLYIYIEVCLQNTYGTAAVNFVMGHFRRKAVYGAQEVLVL
jgi:hypothetical protein